MVMTVVVGHAAIVALKSAVAAVIGDVAFARVTLSWIRTVPLQTPRQPKALELRRPWSTSP